MAFKRSAVRSRLSPPTDMRKARFHKKTGFFITFLLGLTYPCHSSSIQFAPGWLATPHFFHRMNATHKLHIFHEMRPNLGRISYFQHEITKMHLMQTLDASLQPMVTNVSDLPAIRGAIHHYYHM